MGAAAQGLLLRVLEQLDPGRAAERHQAELFRVHQADWVLGELWVSVAEQGVAPFDQPVAVLVGHPEQAAQHAHRQLLGDALHEVEARLGQRFVDHCAGEEADGLLVVGRLVAKQLSVKLGQQVFVDNRGGAGGVLGTEAAAQAAPDGYTLLIISIAHAVNPALYKLTYDPIKSFTPVSILATGPNVLVVNPELPVHDVKELLALAKTYQDLTGQHLKQPPLFAVKGSAQETRTRSSR